MLKKCLNGDCTDFPDIGYSTEDYKCENVYNSSCIEVGEDLNLGSIVVKQGDNLTEIIKKIDVVLNNIKNSSVQFFYNDLIIDDDCIIKSLVDNGQGVMQIHLSLNPDCINTCCNEESVFVITATKYDICGFQNTTLISTCTNTSWYNQYNNLIGTGTHQIISSSGSYYAVCDGKTSNVIHIGYQSECPTYTYTRVKTFYKECEDNYTGTSFTYSKTYTSVLSYQDAINMADNDTTFDTEGQAQADLGECIFNPPIPVVESCFNVYLTNAVCSVIPPTPLPIPVPIPTPTITPTPVPVPLPVPVACVLSIGISNITC